jgi:hypothetical protein
MRTGSYHRRTPQDPARLNATRKVHTHSAMGPIRIRFGSEHPLLASSCDAPKNRLAAVKPRRNHDRVLLATTSEPVTDS